MTGPEAIALAAALIAAILALTVLTVLRGMSRSVERLQASVDELARGAATTDDLREVVAEAVAVSGPPGAVDGKPDLAASRVPAVLRTGPVVKAMAFGTGTAHVARRLRDGKRGE